MGNMSIRQVRRAKEITQKKWLNRCRFMSRRIAGSKNILRPQVLDIVKEEFADGLSNDVISRLGIDRTEFLNSSNRTKLYGDGGL